MTRTTNSRVAGSAFLLYILFGIASLFLGKGTNAEGMPAKLAAIAQHVPAMRAAAVLTLLCCFTALALGVTLYAITREVDPDIAMLGLTCRVGEGVLSGVALQRSLELVSLATATGPDAPPEDVRNALCAHLLTDYTSVIAMFFAVGSTFFSWLLLRGRIVPVALAWLGVVASVLLVLALPLRLANVLDDSIVQLLWGPMALFEIPLALWLLIKGAAAPTRQVSA